MLADRQSELPRVLARSALEVCFAEDGMPLTAGRIVIAPQDQHLFVEGNRLLVRHGPAENGFRPSIDPLFRSAGVSVGAGAIGVILTGTMNDGVSGLIGIKRCGGTTVVQDPEDAEFPDLPHSAITHARPDHVVPLQQMAPLLDRLVREPVGKSPKPPPDIELEVAIAKEEGPTGMEATEALGSRSVFTCPDCDGLLWEMRDEGLTRYRCHVGHAYTLDALATSHTKQLDRAMGSALRALEQHIAILQRLADQSRNGQMNWAAKRWTERIAEYQYQAELIRQALRSRHTPVEDLSKSLADVAES
jgi:two-component system chemotaxis response regulator CheB